MDAIIAPQAEKVARELVTYFTKATAQNPNATRDENLQTAMNMWLNDSIKMAAMSDNRFFGDTVYSLTK